MEDLVNVAYWVDNTNTIVQVNRAWDEFAIANGANSTVLARHILGTNLFDCVVGEAPRKNLEALLAGVRSTAEPHSLFYRCDTPTTMRFMKMVTVLESDGRIRVGHRMLRQLRTYPPIEYRFAPQTHDALTQCSTCSRIRVRDAWYEGTDLFAEDPTRALPSVAVRYDICPACEIIPLQPAEPSALHSML